MPKTNTLPLTQTIRNPSGTILEADATAFKDIVIAGAEGSVIRGLIITSNDTAAKVIQLAVFDGTNTRALGTIQVPAAAGTATDGTTSSVDGLASQYVLGLPRDTNGALFIPLQATYKLQAKAMVALTAAKTITIVAFVDDF